MRFGTITAMLVVTTALGLVVPSAFAQDVARVTPEVSVQRDGAVFHVAYRLPADSPFWAFFTSSLILETREPWRPQQWRILTPGVTLDRVGAYDVLRATEGGAVPREIEVEVRPRHENLEADYSILMFTDGSVAIPDGIFDVFPVASVEAVEALPSDLNGVDVAADPARIRWSDLSGPLLFMGERYDAISSQDAKTYVLFGQAEMVTAERLTTVVDPQLPTWIAEEIQTFSPQVADLYTERLGAGAFDQPTILASWNGPTPGLSSLGGSVMPGLVAMGLEGEGVLEPTPEVLALARWFISHEAAHFWLGQTVHYEASREAWITEGGAQLMAFRATSALDPNYDVGADLQASVDDCAGLAIQPISAAGDRGEHRAYYACGAVFALVAEAVQQRETGGDWFDFLRPLIDQNREDGVLTRQEWLDHLTSVSGDPSLAADIELMLDHGAGDPQSVIASLLVRSGVGFHLEEGQVRLD